MPLPRSQALSGGPGDVVVRMWVEGFDSNMAAACKVLNVAEKNDAAREIASVLSKGRFQRVSYY